MGGNSKYRALRLDNGNMSWASQNVTRKARILDVVYNASNNELVRTKTLVKGCIVQVDATPFKGFFLKKYGQEIGKKDKKGKTSKEEEHLKSSRHVQAKAAARAKATSVDPVLEHLMTSGRLLVRLTSRPGQCGRADGYVLEGEELQFYKRKMERKKKA